MLRSRLYRWAARRADELGNAQGAVKLWSEAIRHGDRSPAAQESLAESYLRLADDARAVPLLRSAHERLGRPVRLALKLAGACQRTGGLEQAEAVLAQAREQDWDVSVVLQLALVRMRLDKLQGAEELLREVIARRPEEPSGHFLLGKLHARGRRVPEALACFEAALRFDPDNADALCSAGEALAELGDAEEAEVRFRKAISVDEAFAPAYLDMGLLMTLRGRLAEAERWYVKATQVAPESGQAWRQLGSTQMRLGQLQASVASLERALSLLPHHPEILTSLGTVHAHDNQLALAEAYFSRVLAVAPDHHQARVNRAFTLLAKGEYERGFAEYEARLKLPSAADLVGDTRWPMWNGEAVAGRTVVVRSEQGFGDAIQMVRLTALLAGQGATVVVETSAPLQRLLAHARGVSRTIEPGASLPADWMCPLMSLPHKLGIGLSSLPAQVPYIEVDAADRERWRDKLGATGGVRIGLVWASNPDNWIAVLKSMPLAELAQAVSGRGARLFSLQVGAGTDELKGLPAGIEVEDHTAGIRDFYDSACLMANLDLVISIDTAAAHLAGGLGKPVWILLHHAPDWRWMTDRADSPWYPTARLFRQKEAGRWNAVLQAVHTELAQFRPVGARAA